MGKKVTKVTNRLVSYRWLLINTLTWGAAFVIVKPALSVTSPFRYLLLRYILAVIFSLPIIIFYLRKLSWQKIISSLKIVIPIELIGTTIALGFLYLGLQKTTAIEASLLNTTQPLFVIVGGLLLLKERQEKQETLGLIIALMGTLLLVIGPEVFNHSPGVSLVGNLMIVVALVGNLFYFPLAKKYYQNLPKFLVTSLSFYIGLVTFFLLSWYEAGSATGLATKMFSDLQQPTVWVASGYMAIFGSIIGLTAYIKGQDGIEASEASLFWYLQPLVYLPLAFILLNETISYSQIGGLALVLVGVLIAEKRWK